MKKFNLKTNLAILNELRSDQTENMNARIRKNGYLVEHALLDVFDVVHKCELIDEHQAEKAYTYLSSQLTDHEQDNTNNKHILNTLLIKLNIETLC